MLSGSTHLFLRHLLPAGLAGLLALAPHASLPAPPDPHARRRPSHGRRRHAAGSVRAGRATLANRQRRLRPGRRPAHGGNPAGRGCAPGANPARQPRQSVRSARHRPTASHLAGRLSHSAQPGCSGFQRRRDPRPTIGRSAQPVLRPGLSSSLATGQQPSHRGAGVVPASRFRRPAGGDSGATLPLAMANRPTPQDPR